MGKLYCYESFTIGLDKIFSSYLPTENFPQSIVFKMVQVLQIELFEQDIPAVVAMVLARCQTAEKQNLLISATGAHGLVTAHQDGQCHQGNRTFYLAKECEMEWTGLIKINKPMHVLRFDGI